MSDTEKKPEATRLDAAGREQLTMTGRHGGRLNRGGAQPGAGRPPNIIRQGFRKNLLKSARRMEQTVRNIEASIERREARLAKALAAKPDDDQLLETYERLILDDQERLLNAYKILNEFLAKYGIGMTFTETQGNGEDVPRPTFYLPANGRDRN